MELVFLLFAPVFGVFVGTLLVSRIGAWIATIVETRRQALSGWSMLSVLFLHSGPWLLAVTIYWAHHTLSQPHSASWPWFFGGICAAPFLWAPVFFLTIRRNKRLEAKREETAP